MADSNDIEKPDAMNSDGARAYDVAYVGSSIVSLASALKDAKVGLRVAVIEAKDTCGGVWASRELFGVAYAENAPHILTNRRALKVLDDLLDANIAMSVMERRYLRWRTTEGRYRKHHGRLLFYYAYFFISCREYFRSKGAGKSILKRAVFVMQVLLRSLRSIIFPKKEGYFLGGSGKTVDMLADAIESNGGSIYRGRAASKIVSDGNLTIYDNTNLICRADKVYLTRHSVPGALPGKDLVEGEDWINVFTTPIFLKLNRKPLIDYYFINSYDGTPLNQTTNFCYLFGEIWGPDVSVVSCIIKRNEMRETKEEEILLRLKQAEVYPDDTVILASDRYDLKQMKLSDEIVNTIQNGEFPNIEYLETFDISKQLLKLGAESGRA